MEKKHWTLKGLFGRVPENMTAIQPAAQLHFEVGHNQYWGTSYSFLQSTDTVCFCSACSELLGAYAPLNTP